MISLMKSILYVNMNQFIFLRILKMSLVMTRVMVQKL